jgi:hypothetical protein
LVVIVYGVVMPAQDMLVFDIRIWRSLASSPI